MAANGPSERVTLPSALSFTIRMRFGSGTFIASVNPCYGAAPCIGKDLTMPAPRRMPFLVYRDQIGVPSEIAFLRRQYIGFARLEPIWIGRRLLPRATEVGERLMRLGGAGLIGSARR